MNISQPQWIIGLMSGTSVDGIDAALIRTDGEQVAEHGAHTMLPYTPELARSIHGIMGSKDSHSDIAQAITLAHADAVESLIQIAGISRSDIALIGFHGQTIYHAPRDGLTVQLGDGALLAARTGISVVADFRSRDVKEGGEGAPLVPLYHAACAHALPKPLAILNIGGVANLTWLGAQGEIYAMDCGTGGALMDDVMRTRLGKSYDENGDMAARGAVDEAVLQGWMAHNFFSKAAPKSLDRNAFNVSEIQDMTTENALATLAAFTVEGVARGLALFPHAATQCLVTGGGRRNAFVMEQLRSRLNMPVRKVEEAGLNGDMLEAEAFAYLAARSVRGLALSLPTTTGVPRAVTGGVFYPA